jgi:ankyrin repeat protein
MARKKKTKTPPPDDAFDPDDEDVQQEALDRAFDAWAAPFEAMNARAEQLAPTARDAAQRGDRKTLRKLVSKNPPYVVLQWINAAVEAGDREMFRGLLQAGFDPAQWFDPEDEEGETLLMRVANSGDADMVAAVLDAGADVNQATEYGHTALGYAAYAGHEAVVRLLLDHGATVDGGGVYPAQLDAAEGGHEAIFRLLQEHSTLTKGDEFWEDVADAEKTLRKAIAQKKRESKRPKPSADKATVALLEAALLGKVPKVVRHLREGADVNGIDQDGATALHAAAIFGKTELARVLLEHGANVNARDYNRRTPLLNAACGGSVELAQLLLDAGAEVNLGSSGKETPLKIAVDRGFVPLVELFLNAGASTHGKDPAALLAKARKKAGQDEKGLQELARKMGDFAERLGGAGIAAELRELADGLDDPEAYAEAHPLGLPATVRLKPRRRLEWDDPDEIDEATQQIESLGFERVGDFSIKELPCRLRAFCQANTSTFAVVYEHDEAGVWVDFVTCYQEGGTATFTNAPAGQEQPHQPGHFKVYAVELEPKDLYQKMLCERPAGELLTIRAKDFAPIFEQRYADSIRWHQSRQ